MGIDITGILEKTVPALLTGAGGSLGTFLKMRAERDVKINDKFKELEALFMSQLKERDQAIEQLEKQLVEVNESLKSMRRDTQDVERTLTDRSNEMRGIRETMHGIVQDGIRMRSILDNHADSIQKLDGELSAFVKSLEERWQHMMRTIGQMEGTLAAAARRISGAFPSPTLPK